MKKLIISGIGLVLLVVVSVLLRQHFRPLSDAEIRQKVVGTWSVPPSASDTATIINEIHSDGSFVSKWSSATSDISLEGRWDVQGGSVVLTLTNAHGTDLHSLGPPVQHYTIVRINKSEMVSHLGGYTNLIVMKRR
jgi:hypothetical protein